MKGLEIVGALSPCRDWLSKRDSTWDGIHPKVSDLWLYQKHQLCLLHGVMC